MCCSRSWLPAVCALVGAAVATGVSCSRKPAPAIPRLAIVRFENLTGDDSLDWMGRAAAVVMSADLAGSRNISVIAPGALRAVDRILGARLPVAPGISTERPAALVSGATRILYGRVSRIGGNLRLDATVEDTARQRIERTLLAVGFISGGVIPLADALARELDHPVRAYEMRDTQALREFSAALDSSDTAAALESFSRSIARDANFGEAYVAWAERAATENKRSETERILALAAARGRAISELDRARLEAIGAGLRGDSAAAARALGTVVRLNPTDVTVFRQLAQANLNARRYQDAAENLRKALSIEPDEAVLLNQLGYTEMFAGNLPAARKPLETYARLRPGDANALDSLGDVHFYLGAFAEAEKYYRQAHALDGNFAGGGDLLKAAQARLITGDIRGADGIFNEYVAARKNDKDPALECRRSEWEFLSGRRRTAIARLESVARTSSHSPDVAAHAYAQLAVWTLETGNRARAREFAIRAMSSRAVDAASLMVQLLTELTPGASPWTARLERAFPGAAQERLRNLVLAYALLFARDFQAVTPVLRQAYERSAPDPQQALPVLLAWALTETGHLDEAAPLVARSPVPRAGGADLFASLTFPRLVFLRAEVLAKQGRRVEAERHYQLFLTLAGPDAEMFGDENRARRALVRPVNQLSPAGTPEPPG